MWEPGSEGVGTGKKGERNQDKRGWELRQEGMGTGREGVRTGREEDGNQDKRGWELRQEEMGTG